ncbi:MAG: 4'-phosphopantetheinyl transferase family protein [Bacteroidia bacterium]
MLSIRKISESSSLALLDLALYAAQEGLSAKRDIERNGTLFLLKALLNEPVELAYNAEGKPYLAGSGLHISISHSHDRLAVIADTRGPTGIDIEQIRDKVLRIRTKFLNRKELKCAGDNVEKLITYWACKEALYKINSLRNIDFVAHLQVDDFEMAGKGILQGAVRVEDFHKKYRLHYEKLEDYMLVYVLDEI